MEVQKYSIISIFTIHFSVLIINELKKKIKKKAKKGLQIFGVSKKCSIFASHLRGKQLSNKAKSKKMAHSSIG